MIENKVENSAVGINHSQWTNPTIACQNKLGLKSKSLRPRKLSSRPTTSRPTTSLLSFSSFLHPWTKRQFIWKIMRVEIKSVTEKVSCVTDLHNWNHFCLRVYFLVLWSCGCFPTLERLWIVLSRLRILHVLVVTVCWTHRGLSFEELRIVDWVLRVVAGSVCCKCHDLDLVSWRIVNWVLRVVAVSVCCKFRDLVVEELRTVVFPARIPLVAVGFGFLVAVTVG